MKKKIPRTEVRVLLSPDEHDSLKQMADDARITKSEFLRLIIQGISLGMSMMSGKGNGYVMGGYGYSFKPKEMEQLFREIGEKLEKAVDIKPIIGNKAVRYKHIRTAKKVA
jgi:hypothetical protein